MADILQEQGSLIIPKRTFANPDRACDVVSIESVKYPPLSFSVGRNDRGSSPSFGASLREVFDELLLPIGRA